MQAELQTPGLLVTFKILRVSIYVQEPRGWPGHLFLSYGNHYSGSLIRTYTHENEEFDNSTGELILCFNDDDDEHQAPYSQQDEEDRNEKELDFHTLHSGPPILTQDDLVLLDLTIHKQHGEVHSKSGNPFSPISGVNSLDYRVITPSSEIKELAHLLYHFNLNMAVRVNMAMRVKGHTQTNLPHS